MTLFANVAKFYDAVDFYHHFGICLHMKVSADNRVADKTEFDCTIKLMPYTINYITRSEWNIKNN